MSGVYLGQVAITRRCRLRWRFDFAGKPSRFGIWNNAGGKQDENFGSSAWCVNKSGLVRAAIEAEIFEGWQVKTLAEVDGHDFVNFRWIEATPAPMSTRGLLGQKIELKGQVLGLAIDSRDYSHSVFVDLTRKSEPRTEDDKCIQLAAWRK